MQAFQAVHTDALHHGVIVGVSLPPGPDPVPGSVLDRLQPAERQYALDLRGYRQVQFVGGRLAAQQAQRMLGRRPDAVLTGPEGAPVPPKGITLSISHKREIALALAARSPHGVVGLDYEHVGRPRPGVDRRVLTAHELDIVNRLPEHRRWTATVLTFSLKEALYKALAPRLKRYIGFDEVEVHPGTNGLARVELLLPETERPVRVDARYRWWNESVLSTVRVHWT